MIIFYTDDRIPQMLQSMIGSTLPGSTHIMNFTLFGLTGESLHHLNPKQEYFPTEELFRDDTESGFDYCYWLQLMQDEGSFMQITYIVGMEFLYGGMTLILVKTMDTPFRMSVTESIMLYISSMYGIDTKLANSIEDIGPDVFDMRMASFSKEGAARISADIEKWQALSGGNLNGPV